MGPVTRRVAPGAVVAFVVGACSGTVVDRADRHSDAGAPSSSGGAASSGAGGGMTTGGAAPNGAGGIPVTGGVTGTGGEDPCQGIVASDDPVIVDADGGRSEENLCRLKFPAPLEGHQLDFSQLNVLVRQAGLSTITLNNVADSRRCTESAWYYDNPGQPSLAILCPAACEHLRGSPTAWAFLLFGCRTMGL